jgi:hypothetical protein
LTANDADLVKKLKTNSVVTGQGATVTDRLNAKNANGNGKGLFLLVFDLILT